MKRGATNTGILASLAAVAALSGSAFGAEEAAVPLDQSQCTLSSREVIEQFVDLLYRQKKVRLAFETWVHPDYIQHKPTLPDGREAVIKFLEALFERSPGRIMTVHRIIASDDIVAVHYHSQADPEDLGYAVVDIFRVKNCRLVEHWDVVQAVPETSENENTMF